MFKFLRRYNKWILAVGGTLLMIVFLIPQAINSLSQGAAVSNAPKATLTGANGEVTVTEADYQIIQNELQLMDRLGLPVPFIGKVENPWHWYLLTEEAKQAGIIGGLSTSGLDPEQVSALRARSGTRLSSRQIEQMLARINGVGRMISLYQTSGQFSDRRLRSAADRLFYVAQAQTVVIPATPEGIDVDPTEDEIREQMEAFADTAPDDPESDTTFGYKLPDRVKIEWLTIPASSVRSVIEQGDELTGMALRKHWRLNVDNGVFPPIPDVPPTEVPDVVREDLLESLTLEKMDEIERAGANQLRAPTHALKRENGYLVLPDDWTTQRLDLRSLATTVVDRFGTELPSYESTGDRWLASPDLLELDGIGSATAAKFPPRPLPINRLIPLLKEFEGSTTILLQEGVAGPAMRDDDGNIYFYRVIATDAARAPQTIDEVREQVVDDLRRKRHYEMLLDQVSEIEAMAETESLAAVAMTYDTIQQQNQAVGLFDPTMIQIQTITRQPLSPVPTSLPEVGPHEATVETIVDYARETIDNTALDQLTEAQRIIAVPVEDKLAIVVCRLLHEVPFSESTFTDRVNQNQIQQVLLNEELDDGELILEAFSYDAIKVRHGFTELRAPVDPEDATTQPDEAVATAGE